MSRTKEARILEESLTIKSSCTANDFELVSEGIYFPEDVAGLYILDICGGASLATGRLRMHGAKAFAIDYKYKDRHTLKRSIDDYLLDPGLFPMDRIKQEYIRRMRKNRDIFLRNLNGTDKPLVAALAGDLPFANESFDMCYSTQGISPAILGDLKIFTQAYQEGMRVLKKGGQFQIYPWFIENGRWDRTETANANSFITSLTEQNVDFLLRPEKLVANYMTLIITKS